MLRSMRRLASGGAILCYHAVTNPDFPSESSVNVPSERLEEDLRILTSHAEVVPLAVLLDRQRAGRSCAGLAGITFDDAYQTVAILALPLLVRYAACATVFVTCEALEGAARFWWDRIDCLHARIPSRRWRHFEDELGLPESYRKGQPREMGPLRPLRQWILAQFAGRWPAALEAALAALEGEYGSHTAQHCMSVEELDRLAAHPLISLGVHTWSHPVLPLLPEGEQRREIARCRDWLRGRYSEVLPALAFPFGLFDRRSAEIAREEGMEASFSLAERTLRGAETDDVLPRISGNRDMAGWKLRLRLTGWFDDRVQRGRGLARDYPALPSPTS